MTVARIVTLADRPDLAATVANWLWEAFWRHEGAKRAELEGLVAAAVAGSGLPRTFVLLAGREPAGTASLAEADLDLRPDLTPWLAGVFVAPGMRGRGYATRLVTAVADAARAAGVRRLWLYTAAAEGLYARIGWRAADRFDHGGSPNVLMSRDLDGA